MAMLTKGLQSRKIIETSEVIKHNNANSKTKRHHHHINMIKNFFILVVHWCIWYSAHNESNEDFQKHVIPVCGRLRRIQGYLVHGNLANVHTEKFGWCTFLLCKLDKHGHGHIKIPYSSLWPSFILRRVMAEKCV